MRMNITGRHMELSTAFRNYAEKKIARLQNKYDRISEIELILDHENVVYTVEMILKVDGHQPFVVRYSDEDAYASIDAVMDKIERQLTRHKEKVKIRKGRTATAEAAAEALEARSAESEEQDEEFPSEESEDTPEETLEQ